MLGRKLQAGGTLQLAALDQAGDARIERAGHPLARHHGDVAQLAPRPLQPLALRQLGDQLLVGQLAVVAGAVHQDDVLEALPGLQVLEDGEEGRQAGAGADQPEIAAIGEAVEGQVAGGLLLHQQLVAGLEATQLAGELAAGHHDGEELQVLVMRRRDHRVGAPDDTAAGLAHAETDELPGTEAEAGVAGAAQAEQAGRPDAHLGERLAGELLFAGGHNLPPSLCSPQFRAKHVRQTPTVPMPILDTPFAQLDLIRQPEMANEPLQAFDAADEYLLNHLNEQGLHAYSRVLLLNDGFGALACSLAAHCRVTSSGDSHLSHLALQKNLARNGLAADRVNFVPASAVAEGPFDWVLVRVPKTLALLEEQLIRL